MPDGIGTIAAAREWHEQNDRIWNESPPPRDPEFTRTWFLRCKELVDKYKPDMLYFDDTELPLGQTGLDITAHYYNANMRWHKGNEEAVVAAKEYTPEHMGASMLDIERGRAQGILDAPWQTDTCIGEWHYKRSIFEQHKYKTPNWVAQSLVDIVSKNGNLMLNIPVRGDGTIDEDEHAFLEEFGRWMAVNGEAIYGTRPFKIYGEGLLDVTGSHNFNEDKARAFDASDIRFTTKGDRLYFFALGWPADGKLVVKSLAKGNSLYPRAIRTIEMLGMEERLQFQQTSTGLEVKLAMRPDQKVNAFAFRVLS
jgi:alpha-L-fucosidase